MSAELLLDSGTEREAVNSPDSPRRDAEPLERVMTVLAAVQKWATAEDRVARVYISAEQGVFRVRAASVLTGPDFELTTSLTDLALALTDRGIDTIGSRIPNLDPDELTAFFDPTDSIAFFRR